MMKILSALILLTSSCAFAGYSPPFIILRLIDTSKNTCNFELENIDPSFAIEWQYSDLSPYWSLTSSSSGKSICENKASCLVQSTDGDFQKNKPYYFNARQFIDDNDNGQRDAGEFVREWSPVLLLKNNRDYIHRCTIQ